MPRLILLRHAKSDWDDAAQSDFDRCVSERGQRDIAAVSAKLGPFLAPGCQVLCSPARRTRDTLELASPQWPVAQVQYIDSLYECGVTELCQAVRGVEQTPSGSPLVVIAHNPGLVMFLNWCLAEDEVTADCFHMPTSCAAVLELATGFAELQPGQAKLTAFIKARDLIPQQAEALSC